MACEIEAVSIEQRAEEFSTYLEYRSPRCIAQQRNYDDADDDGADHPALSGPPLRHVENGVHGSLGIVIIKLAPEGQLGNKEDGGHVERWVWL